METQMAHDLLDRLRQRQEDLNRSERKVACVILDDPAAATSLSIANLAQAAGVSEPTVNRFCRNFNAKGYPDFKIKLAQSLAGGTPYVTRAVEPDDNASQYTNKIFGATIAALDEARRDINVDAVERMVDYLTQAKQIHFFGLVPPAPWRRMPSTSFSALTYRSWPTSISSCSAWSPRPATPATSSW